MSPLWKGLVVLTALVCGATLFAVPYLYFENRQRATEVQEAQRNDPCAQRPVNLSGCVKFLAALGEIVPPELSCSIVEQQGYECRVRRTPRASSPDSAAGGSTSTPQTSVPGAAGPPGPAGADGEDTTTVIVPPVVEEDDPPPPDLRPCAVNALGLCVLGQQ